MPRRRWPPAWEPNPQIGSDLWDLQRRVHLLGVRLQSERRSLETWQLCLARRREYERTHVEPSQLPAYEQACAATHARLLDLAAQLAEAQTALRTLRNRGDT
jgi:hypothetical protein